MTAAAEPLARVLVVDDDPGVRYTLREILEAEGLAVDEAADGAAALARLDQAFAPLVLTDLRMPGLDGLELLRRLRERAPAPRVVLITAHGSERTAVEAMKARRLGLLPQALRGGGAAGGGAARAGGGAARATRTSGWPGELALSRTMVFASRGHAPAGRAGGRGWRRAT